MPTSRTCTTIVLVVYSVFIIVILVFAAATAPMRVQPAYPAETLLECLMRIRDTDGLSDAEHAVRAETCQIIADDAFDHAKMAASARYRKKWSDHAINYAAMPMTALTFIAVIVWASAQHRLRQAGSMESDK